MLSTPDQTHSCTYASTEKVSVCGLQGGRAGARPEEGQAAQHLVGCSAAASFERFQPRLLLLTFPSASVCFPHHGEFFRFQQAAEKADLMLDDDLLQEEAAGEEKERQDMKLAALRVGGGGNASYLRMTCKSSPHSTSFLIPQPPSPNLPAEPAQGAAGAAAGEDGCRPAPDGCGSRWAPARSGTLCICTPVIEAAHLRQPKVLIRHCIEYQSLCGHGFQGQPENGGV